uniref:PH domain-containing protein n=1 Tax=Phytophthora ramorum TaxID=164328 RepID=H3GDA9_PHYRM
MASLEHADSLPPVSARDASYWLAVASAPPSSRSGAVSSSSMSSSTRSLDASSFLFRGSSFLDVYSSNKSLLEPPPASDSVPAPPPSLYDSTFFAPTRPEATRGRNRKHSHATDSKKPVVVVEEVYEHQRYQMVLGWGSKGHLLPLDPDKYMRVVRHSMQRRRRRRAQDDGVLLEWFPSSTFPTILLPEAEKTGANTLKQRSRSATSAGSTVTRHPAPQTATSVSGSSLVGPRWEWASPWHLEVLVDSPSEAVDGWQYASGFSHFTPRPSLRSRGRSIDSLSQSSQAGGDMPSSSPASASGKRLRVRRRKWVRYRRLRSGRSSLSSGTSSSAFDDAFLDSMSGWLRKRGHVRKNWKARYFVLEKSVLRYYTDPSCAKLKGEVLLFHPQTRVHYVDVHVAGGRDASFAIQVGPEYTLLLQAAQLRDRENWMYCIEDALLCRDSYHPQGMTSGPGPYFDLRESVAQRRLLSAEAMALDGSSFQDNLGGISHAHGGAVSDELSDEEEYDDRSESSSSHRQRRSSHHGGSDSNGSDVLRLWASLHAKPGGVLSAHIAGFLVVFRQKYEHPVASSVTTMEPWTPVGAGGNESDSDQELREGSLAATPQELQNVTTLQDARSLLALKNYRFFLERSLELIMEHLSKKHKEEKVRHRVQLNGPPSAMRSGVAKPPSSRVRFEGHETELRESIEKFERDSEAERKRLHQQRKEREARHQRRREQELKNVNARAKGSGPSSPIAAATRGRRSASVEKPPNSAIKLSAYEDIAQAIPTSPVGRPRRSSISNPPPKSDIKVSAFDDLVPRRRTSAGQDNPPEPSQPADAVEDEAVATPEPAAGDTDADQERPSESDNQQPIEPPSPAVKSPPASVVPEHGNFSSSDEEDSGDTSGFESDDSYIMYSDSEAELSTGYSIFDTLAVPEHQVVYEDATDSDDSDSPTDEPNVGNQAPEPEGNNSVPSPPASELSTVKEEEDEVPQPVSRGVTARDLAFMALGRASSCSLSDLGSPVSSANGKESPRSSMVPMSYTPASSAFPPSRSLGRPPVPATTGHTRSRRVPPPSSSMSNYVPRSRTRAPMDLKNQLPPSIGVLSGLSSGSSTFVMDPSSFYQVTWKTGEFAFSVQRVYTEENEYEFDDRNQEPQLFLRMLLNTERSTCRSFHDVRLGDVLIRVGDSYVSDLGLEGSGTVLTKFFARLTGQTPIKLTFQRMYPSDWEGGVEL